MNFISKWFIFCWPWGHLLSYLINKSFLSLWVGLIFLVDLSEQTKQPTKTMVLIHLISLDLVLTTADCRDCHQYVFPQWKTFWFPFHWGDVHPPLSAILIALGHDGPVTTSWTQTSTTSRTSLYKLTLVLIY